MSISTVVPGPRTTTAKSRKPRKAVPTPEMSRTLSDAAEMEIPELDTAALKLLLNELAAANQGSQIDEVLSALEAIAGERPLRLTEQQVTVVRDGVLDTEPLQEIAARAGLEPEQVLDIVATFGTWLGHKNKRSRNAPAFTLPLAPLGEGFKPRTARNGGTRRNVTKSYSRIAYHKPDQATIHAWLQQVNPPEGPALDFATVSTLHTMAELGQLKGIPVVCDGNPAVAATQLEALRLLEHSRVKGVRALSAIEDAARNGIRSVEHLQELVDACALGRWVFPKRMERLEESLSRYLAACTARPQRANSVLQDARNPCINFAAFVMSSPVEEKQFDFIGDLSHAHVVSICQNHNLDARIAPVDIAAVTRKISELNKSNAELEGQPLIRLALACDARDMLDAFWTIAEIALAEDPYEAAGAMRPLAKMLDEHGPQGLFTPLLQTVGEEAWAASRKVIRHPRFAETGAAKAAAGQTVPMLVAA